MEILNNGWVILDKTDFDIDSEKVICCIPSGGCPFSIHTRRKDNPKALFWGHYYNTFEGVVKAWLEIKKERG